MPYSSSRRKLSSNSYDLETLERIVIRLEQNPANILDELPIILHQLRASKVPSGASECHFTCQEDMPKPARLATEAMVALCMGLEEEVFAIRPSCTRLLEAALQELIQWFQWLNESYIANSTESPGAELVVFRALHQYHVAKILVNMVEWVIPSDRILTSPGLISFLWQMWLDKPALTKTNASFGDRGKELGLLDDFESDETDPYVVNGRDEPSISRVLRCLVDRLQDQSWDFSVHQDALQTLRADPTKVAHMACRQAEVAAFGGAVPNTLKLHDALTILIMLSTCSGYRKSCRARNALSTVLAIAEHLIRNAPQLPSDESLALVLSRCMSYMVYVLKEGYHAVLEFVQDGGLSLIFKATSIMGLEPSHRHRQPLPDAAESYLTTFAYVIRAILPFLSFLPIFRHARRTLIHVRSARAEDMLLSKIPEAHEFTVYWNKLADRLEAIEKFRSSRGLVRLENEICNNFTGHDTNPSRRQRIKKCAGCLWKFYCSKSCQKQDWTLHKKECMELQQLRQDGHFSSLPIPNRDVVFLAGYCVAYADKYLAEEIAHAHLNSKANSADGEPEIVVINLRHFPETISTVNSSGALSEEDEQVGKGKGAWMTSVIFIFPSNKDADSKIHVGWMDLTRFGIGRK